MAENNSESTEVPMYNGIVIPAGKPHPEDVSRPGTSTATSQYGTTHYMHYDRDSEFCGTFEKHNEAHKDSCPYCAFNDN